MTEPATTVICTHCLLEVKKNTAIHETIDQDDAWFCCHGCQSVYHVLKGEGFQHFYDKRREWEAGPPEKTNVSEDLFVDQIIDHGQEMEVSFLLTGIRCASCIWLVESFLGKQEGITYVRLNYATHKARVRWIKDQITLSEIFNKINSIGYCPLPANEGGNKSLMEKERKDYFYRFSVAAFFTMQLMMYTAALYAGYFQGMDAGLRQLFRFLAWIMATPVMIYSAFPFIKNSIRSLRHKALNMDTLVFLGSGSAYLYSIAAIFDGAEIYFDTSAMIITLILLGRLIEAGAKVKAGNAVAKLLSLQPRQVRKLDIRTSETIIVAIDQIKSGDAIEILPGDTVPTDGLVISGDSEIDESMLTGESQPVLKSSKQNVFAGTSNLNGKLTVQVTESGAGTLLSKIAAAVEEAQEKKAPIQNIADSVVAYFVPVIILIALATFAVRAIQGGAFLDGVMNAVSVLVIACPCALGLATPLAILVGTGRIAQTGVILKSGETIEKLSQTDTFCFDKTGTITRGALQVNDIVSLSHRWTVNRLRLWSASLEINSRHLISNAIVHACDDQLLPVTGFKEFPGKGVSGQIDGKEIHIGNRPFMEETGVSLSRQAIQHTETLIQRQLSVVYIAIDRSLTGLIALTDSIRPEARAILNQLSGEYTTIVLTGDHHTAAQRLAQTLDIPNLQFKAELTPFDKTKMIETYNTQGRHTTMIGDGINDAPALTEAWVGIAMGKGTDIALESADAVLLRGDLNALPHFLHISKKTLSIIKQNLFWAFSYNAAAIPLAVAGVIHPIVSAAFMSLSSLIVVLNSLRLKNA